MKDRDWEQWVKATYPVDHIGAALALLARIATALEKIAQREEPPP